MLANFTVEKETIKFRGGEFAVRGIGLDTIAALMADGNRDELEEAVGQLELLFKATKSEDQAAIKAGLSKLVMQLPGLTAKVIAYAADEPGEADKVRKLPVSLQLQAILAIGRLTFDGEDSIKNFVGGLVTLMASMTKTMSIATGQIALNGTKASAAQLAS